MRLPLCLEDRDNAGSITQLPIIIYKTLQFLLSENTENGGLEQWLLNPPLEQANC